jgi:hypothetical protein
MEIALAEFPRSKDKGKESFSRPSTSLASQQQLQGIEIIIKAITVKTNK